MKDFIEYIETSCENLPDNHITYLYKKYVLDEMTKRANEITHAGLKDERVLADLMADEYPELEAHYWRWAKEYKKRKRAKPMAIAMILGGVLYFLAIFITYFEVSAATRAWRESWLIIVGGLFSMIIFYTGFAIHKIRKMRRVFQPIARVLIAMCIMLFMIFVFLFCLMMFGGAFKTWPLIMLGIIFVLTADIIFAFVTKQKFRTVTTMVYMPIISTMFYIILGAYGIIDWGRGAPVILLGVIIDIVYIIAIALSNAKYFMYKREDEE